VQYATRAVRVAQVSSAAFFFFGEQIFGKLGRRPPELLGTMHDNKLLTVGAIYGMDVVAQTFKSINAFEITYNGKVLHSKLKSGQFPDPNEVATKLREIIEADGGDQMTGAPAA